MLMSIHKPLAELEHAAEFAERHIGPTLSEEQRMLRVIGGDRPDFTRQALIDAIVPASIARSAAMGIGSPASEPAALSELEAIAARNRVLKSFIGQGYHGTHTPGVILRNVLESPAWYTAYTPYQAEISQGRLEALATFQTMVAELTGMAVANASMLDEATAAAEAMTLAKRAGKSRSNVFHVADDVLPQTLAVLKTRAEPLGIEVRCFDADSVPAEAAFGVLLQYPGVNGRVRDPRAVVNAVKAHGGLVVMAADPLALALLMPPGELGADIAIGTTQRFGMPMGGGGPHAAYIAVRDELKRSLPGRLVGASVDAHGQSAYRLALQTREQHIRREKATSNICTAQVLPAVVAAMYAVYHGPQGLKRIARRVASFTAVLAEGLIELGCKLRHDEAFDTLEVTTGLNTDAVIEAALALGMNLRRASDVSVSITLDETTTRGDLAELWQAFGTVFAPRRPLPTFERFEKGIASRMPSELLRSSAFLTHPVFNRHHSETAMLRYLRRLADRDLALDRTMIPLGSCTMKLNASAEMIPITWPAFAGMHPYAPRDQQAGTEELARQLSHWLSRATGYAGVSLQPNAGSQGEFAGLLAIRAWHASRGEGQRRICLIPESAHGTNPASAQMAGLSVVPVRCDEMGNVDLTDLEFRCIEHQADLAAVMITYPSTYGVFEPRVKELCALVHRYGGRVYVDGANMNALVGLAAPGEFGGDVSHLNLHKTFCIPHGGGGPGVGPVCVVGDLLPFLPAEPAAAGDAKAEGRVGAVSAAPWGNTGVLPISWMYIRMMGDSGLRAATEVAILNANYIAARLVDHYDIHYSGEHPGIKGGGVAHECILDLRPLKETSGVTAEDVAKRLIDYGFHAPTLSFPVAGTLMVEPTESESLAELDRFCDAMIAIREEIRRVEFGSASGHVASADDAELIGWSREDNPLKHAPHTAQALLAATWPHAYTREQAAYPLASVRQDKYWPPVGRIDNVYGDRNLFCSCVVAGDD